MGPGIGPAAAPPPLATLPPAHASLPAPPMQAAAAAPQYAAATVSSGPQPASMYGAPGGPTPVMLPPLHYQGLSASQPFGYGPPQGGVPQHGQTPPVPAQQGTVRGADAMDEDGDAPPAKRQKVAKLPGGQFYPEQDWISMHPVRSLLLPVVHVY